MLYKTLPILLSVRAINFNFLEDALMARIDNNTDKKNLTE